MEKMKLSHAGLANYLKSLVEKQFLVKDDKGRIRIKKFLVPSGEEQNFSINIKKV